MKKNRRLLISLLFLAVSGVVIFSSNLSLRLFPAQEVDFREGAEFSRLVKGYLFTQEITAAKEWLAAIDLPLASPGAHYSKENTLQVLDAGYRPLYTERFASERTDSLKYRTFIFPKKLHVGKGNKVILCLSSRDGDKDNSFVLARTAYGKLGKLSVKPLIAGGGPGTSEAGAPVLFLPGSLCVRTYETNSGFINWYKVFLFFAAFLAASLSMFAEKLKPAIAGLRFAPVKIYAALALGFGLALVFITPPLQTPDEDHHLYRAYQLSEFNVFQFDSSVPASLVKLADTFKRMNFRPLGKTGPGEILSLRKEELDPSVRSVTYVPDFIFPYLPQALGVFIARQFNASPLTLLYAGRIFNLLFSVALICFAIRTAPFFKWIFLLLGLMPMTLYLCASLSKDAMIFGLSFWLIALFLRLSYGGGGKIRAKELAALFALSFFTGAGRSIYLVLAGLFLLIPVHRIGSLKKYILIFACLLFTVFMATRVWSLRPLFQPAYASASPVPAPGTQPKIPAGQFMQPDETLPPAGTDFSAQQSFILNNPGKYLRIVFNTVFIHFRAAYLDSFIGTFGWLIRPLPKWHVNLYWGILFLTALLSSGREIKTGLKDRLIPAGLFAAGVFIVETGLYLGWTPVGQYYIAGVQGRYFIPYAPLFFLLLHNDHAGNLLRPGAALVSPAILYNSCRLLLVCFSVISLAATLYAVLAYNYIVLF